MPTITTEAYAKINLWLTVGDRRADGYHEIESIMQRVSLCDLVTVTRVPDGGARKIAVHASDLSLPAADLRTARQAEGDVRADLRTDPA